jgi:transcriptional regulator with XRE-family HTH domain
MKKRLEAARKGARMNQAELAEEIGVSYSTIRRYEEEPLKIPLEHLLNISKATGENINWLIFGEAKEIPLGAQIAELIRKIEGSDEKTIKEIISIAEAILIRNQARRITA